MSRQAKASGSPCGLPNSRQLEPAALGSLVGAWMLAQQWEKACYWGDGGRASREGRSAALRQHGKSIAFFISTAEYYYAFFLAFMNVTTSCICQKSIISYPWKLVANVATFPACRSTIAAHCIQNRKTAFLLVAFHTNLQLGKQR